MKSRLLFTSLLIALGIYSAQAQDSVRVNSAVTYQTIAGWGHGGGILGSAGPAYSMLDSSIADPVNYQIMDYLADELGLTGSRTWEVGPRVDGTGMDNGDCDVIDWNKFQAGTFPAALANYLVYFKNKVVAKGYQPSFYSSPGYPTHATDQKPWIMYHPGERAQQIWASALYMKNTYGININYDVIYNEPTGLITSTILADDVKALGPRLIAQGLSTRSQMAEGVSPQVDWTLITPLLTDTAMWNYVGRLSYHNYGTADPYRANIYNFGQTMGLTTAQTEMGNPTFDELYSDMTIANTSYWEVAYSGSATLVPDTGLSGFTPSATFFRLHQVMHYVTPGSVRISATPTDTLLHVLSFSKSGAVTTVIDNTNNTARTVILTGIPAGTYGLSRAAAGGTFFQELGLQTVGVSGSLSVSANGGGTVTTLYPYTGPNHAPSIMTYGAHPGYLVLPASAATLSASANDAELDALSYQWTVTSHPAGANPVLVTPTALTTSVSGLTVAGTYVFTIAVHDALNTTSRKVYLVVYGTNPPPVLGSAGFRIGVPYGLVFGNPGDTTHANIELPTSSLTLQIGISDLANSSFTGRGTWSLVSQPAGANAILSATTYIFVSIRSNVTGMTVPGDYVFQVNVINPGHPDLTAQIICTVHPASSPPVINSITPSPAVMTLPTSSTLLTAVTSDPDSDLLRHWWVITSAPYGSNPVFDHQGLPISHVSGLTVPGTYTFTLRAFDDLHMVTRNVTVTVNAGTTCINVLSAAAPLNNNVLCYGGATGKATVHATGAARPFTYAWSSTPAQTDSILDNVRAGIYSVTVTDANGCTATTSVTISQPVQLAAATSAVNATCGSSNGSATVNASAGTAPYTYLWTGGATTSTVPGLPVGNYTVIVTDNNGCKDTAVALVNSAGTATVSLSAGTTSLCSGDSAHICATAGFPVYLWSSGQATPCIYVRASGAYTVTVTDSNSCMIISNTVNISVHALPQPSFTVSHDSLIASAASSYQWYLGGNAISGATSAVYVAAQSGSYAVKVVDTNGCSGSSAASTVAVLGINTLTDDTRVTVYPNPFTSQTTIQISSSIKPEATVLKVLDLLGHELSSITFGSEGKIVFNKGELSSGVYFYQVSREHKIISTGKMVIE